MAAIREAKRRGADDVIFVSSDGFVMEGPTSSVVIRAGDVYRTPATEIGILAGTTQLALFAHLQEQGFSTASGAISIEQLRAADELWLVSSVRLAAPVTSLDGEPRTTDAPRTAAFNRALLGRVD
jgi:4-amino-4-deoxychorismate lyase